MLKDQKLLRNAGYINGEWVTSEKNFEVKNPYDGQLVSHVPDLGVKETRTAIEAAFEAQKIWSSFTASKRSKIMRNWYDLQKENADDLAYILTLEQGKPLAEAKGEVLYGAAFVEWFSEEAKRAYGDVIPGHKSDSRIVVIKQPVGVVAAITPWNFPNAMITRKVAPALAAGCTAVIKPAEDTPLSALALAELAERAGIPAGVFNVITTKDPRAVGEELTSNKLVRKVSFTGSTEVGKILYRQSADTVKKISLELGGNAPFIVFEDADLDAAVSGAMASKYRNAGQTCICSNRFYVHNAIVDEFLEKLIVKMKKIRVGSGLDKETTVGPLINSDAVEKVESLISDATSQGGRIITGGKRHQKGGNFFEPTIVSDVTPSMRIHNEEIFGPVVPVYTFDSDDEVIEMANNTPYGLAAYFYGRDVNRVWKVSEALEYGMVGVNTGLISTPLAPFGGVKESGIGREGSKYGLDEFLEVKYICFGGIT